MYLQKELIKAINEMYYRQYQNTIMKPLSKDVTKEEIDEFHNTLSDMEHMKGFILSDGPDSIYYLALDLEKSINEGLPASYSTFGKEIQNRITVAINRVQKQVIDNLTPEAVQFIEILRQNFNADSYIVGGFVRDAIAGRTSNDVDFCTSIPYDILKEVFQQLGWRTKDTGKQFLVLNISHPETKENFEVAALRKDKDNSGAEVGTIEEDAQRRDFVNSCIYFSLKTEQLIDPSGMAIMDCQSNLLRFMGKAKDRLDEDPIRAMRFYKFVGRGWEPEAKSLRAVRERLQNDAAKITELQTVLTLPGVAEAIAVQDELRNTTKMCKMHKMELNHKQLSETLIHLERMRLEVEKMVGL